MRDLSEPLQHLPILPDSSLAHIPLRRLLASICSSRAPSTPPLVLSVAVHDHLLVAVPVDLIGKTGGAPGHRELLSSLLLFCLSFFLVFFRTLFFLFVLLSCARLSSTCLAIVFST
jgi:hypothetical protein